MKLKCRINGKDYDIVQGATFVDNFNETLDSASICLDQVYKIDNLQPYDDVFIWNADEEFVGYGNIGDIIEFDYTIKIGGDLIGTGVWSTPVDLGTDGIIVVNEGSYFELSGPICQIWAYRFYDFTNSNENTCRFDKPEISISITFEVSNGETSTTVTENGFSLRSINNQNHGLRNSQIVLSNGTYTFSCVYVPENESFLVASNQSGENESYNIISMNVVSASYKTQDIDKIFTIRTSIPTFTSDGVNNFQISLLYRGINYAMNATNIEIVDDLTRKVLFDSVSLGAIEFVFTKNNATQKIWTATLQNSVPLILDTLNIFAQVDNIKVIELTGTQNGTKAKPSFYKHLLIDSFTEEMVGLETGLYKYQIDLFSETKKLEKIILPNISVTQSLVQEEKRTCWFYLEKYLDTFSPKYKKVSNTETKSWQYVNKYAMSESGVDRNGIIANLKEVFDKTICPEFSLTNPSLKDLIAQIMIVKDMIPVVKDDVIYGMDIGNLVGDFDRTGNSDYNATNFTISSMDSANFATDARREHSNALSQENSAHLVEYLGFRTPNSPFLTLDQLVLETRFPIYKINSIKMCYYKKATLFSPGGEVSAEKIFLCKQDITPLVMQNVVRNTLSTNWRTFVDRNTPQSSVHDYSNVDYSDVTATNTGLDYAKQYKICTIGYDIGSNKIDGWGESYQYLDVLWFKAECSYIENIVNLVDHINAFGLMSKLEIKGGEGYSDIYVPPGLNHIVAFDGSMDNIAKQIKSIVFEVDYDALYNGTVMHSKDNIDKDDLVTADNCSAALTVLESDGLFEREKMNRLGNKTFKLTARYDKDNGGSNVNRVQNVGTYDEITNSIIYTREYSIYDNLILANYEATYEYILKNYFTSVWAKYRTYSLMSYGESIRRAENVRKLLVLSKDEAYFENIGADDDLLFQDISTAKYFLSFVTPTVIDNLGKIRHNEKLNCGYFLFYKPTWEDGWVDRPTGYYLSDINTFASGTSLCFNIATYDNVSGGNYIDSMSANLAITTGDVEKAMDYKTTQKWWNMVDSVSDAFVEKVGFYVCHLNNGEYFHDYLFDNADVANVQGVAPYYTCLPRVEDPTWFEENSSNKIGVKKKQLCKDNKEILDMTMQFSFISHDNDNVLFSPWICKLNDFVGYYDKFAKNETILTDVQTGSKMFVYVYDKMRYDWTDGKTKHKMGTMVIKIKKSAFDAMSGGDVVTGASLSPITFKLNGNLGNLGVNQAYEGSGSGTVSFNNIQQKGEDFLTLIYTFGASFKYESYQYFLWFKFNVYTNSGNYIKNSNVRLNKVAEEAIDGDPDDKYYYFRGDLTETDFRCYYTQPNGQATGDPSKLGWVDFACFKTGNDDPTALNLNNSLVCEPSISANIGTYKSVRKNMFIVVSSQKVKRRLEFNFYKYSLEDSINTFSNDMYVDNGVTINDIFSIFQTNNNYVGLQVNPERYDGNPNIPFQVKSIQYYYRDNNTNTMYFVFGVNLPEISQNKTIYDGFKVYLSVISKRCMDVYDENHNIVGKVANALENQNIPFNEQHYVDIQKLPSDYQEVEFLESDGNQIIDFENIILDEYSSVEGEVMISDSKEDYGYLFGYRSGSVNDKNSFAILANNMPNDGVGLSTFMESSQTGKKASERISLNPNTKYKIVVYPNDIYIDDILAARIQASKSINVLTRGCCLFGCKKTSGVEDAKFIGRIYNFKIRNVVDLVHNFVPCIRISDQKPGVYDTITGEFYTNSGLGEFKFRF